jgi:hypothetical protein
VASSILGVPAYAFVVFVAAFMPGLVLGAIGDVGAIAGSLHPRLAIVSLVTKALLLVSWRALNAQSSLDFRLLALCSVTLLASVGMDVALVAAAVRSRQKLSMFIAAALVASFVAITAGGVWSHFQPGG